MRGIKIIWEEKREMPTTVALNCHHHKQYVGMIANHSCPASTFLYTGDLQDLLELTLKKDVPFTIGDCDAKLGSQKIP